MSRSGSFRKLPVGYTAFFPAPLPPTPPVIIDGELQLLLSQADRALGGLNMVVTVLPNPDLLVEQSILTGQQIRY